MVLAVNMVAGIAILLSAGPALVLRALWRERGTRRKLSEVEAAHAKLAASQADYRQLAEFKDALFENAPLSMIATDHDGVVTAMNAAAEKLSGYSRSELVGLASITILYDEKELDERAGDIVPGMSAAAMENGFDVLVAQARNGEDLEETEWTYVLRDGSRKPVSVAVRAVSSDAGEIGGYVVTVADITERKHLIERMTHMATHDHLTKLAGRGVLQESTAQAVERARRYGTKVAAFLIDIDQLKRINDSIGHANGDKVLIEVAARLKTAVRSSDIVARIGGDEFIVVMPDIMTTADAEQCGLNLVQQIAPAIMIDDHEIHVTASVGACIYPDYASDAKHLLKRADAAMYAAKEDGRNQCRIFTEDMLKETADRLSMEHALRHALAKGELSLHYQPQVSLATGNVVGVEALLRWTHPKLGHVQPSVFISLAEETGLIVPIGEWAIRTACAETMQMREELAMDLSVSVNLSPRQFQQKNLTEVIENALKLSGLPSQNLEIEITENMVMLNSQSNLDKLQRIRALGAKIAIDDFGTGFCSFTYLLQYQVDRLKIDQSFVRQAVSDANAAAVVRTIIAMSHGLNMRVVAEGVESEEQLKFLLRRRCDEAQGRFFSSPVSEKDCVAAVRSMSDFRVFAQL
jgi:diguanylate cyclase (GGDEF)-like protein